MWFDVIKDITSVGLIRSRHDMPVDDFIWDELPKGSLREKYPLLEKHVEKWIEEKEVEELHLYVTGFTPALTTFLRIWNNRSKLVLYQYDSGTGEYEAEVWFNG